MSAADIDHYTENKQLPAEDDWRLILLNDGGELAPLRKLLEARARAYARRTGRPAARLPIKIRADAEVEYKYVQRVLEVCRSLGVERLSFGAAPTQAIPF